MGKSRHSICLAICYGYHYAGFLSISNIKSKTCMQGATIFWLKLRHPLPQILACTRVPVHPHCVHVFDSAFARQGRLNLPVCAHCRPRASQKVFPPVLTRPTKLSLPPPVLLRVVILMPLLVGLHGSGEGWWWSSKRQRRRMTSIRPICSSTVRSL